MSKYEDYYNAATKGGGNPKWFDVSIIPLAQDLQAATGLTASADGCYGLRCECFVTLTKDGKTRSLCITPQITQNGLLELYYDTGKTTNEYADGTLGALNGFNNISERLPDTIEEIAKLFHIRGIPA